MDFLWDALKDSLIIVPFLLGAYILIEFLETLTSNGLKPSRLKSPLAPIFGSVFGLLPQCGFSVVATDLFSNKKITMGTLIAIFIATSDEALPLLIISPEKALYLAPLLLIKFFYAIIIGYSVDGFYSLISKRKNKNEFITSKEETAKTENKTEEHEENEEHCHVGCCGHTIEEETKEHWAHRYLLHPALHTLKIFAYILIVNIAFSGLIAWVGEESLMNFLNQGTFVAPLFSMLIGLIPNCASSIVLTQLFIKGGLSFGALLAGLSCNAGLGLIVLIRQNKSIKQNLSIIGILVAASLILGYATILIMMLF